MRRRKSVYGIWFYELCGLCGTAVSTFTIGVLVEQKGWNVTIGSWVVMTFLALVVCMLGRKKFS